MSSFADREKAFESKYAHDAEMQFKAASRANKALGAWAAALLGKTGAEVDAYVTEVIKSDFEEAGNEDVFRKLSADLGSKASEAEIRAKMDECIDAARASLLED